MKWIFYILKVFKWLIEGAGLRWHHASPAVVMRRWVSEDSSEFWMDRQVWEHQHSQAEQVVGLRRWNPIWRKDLQQRLKAESKRTLTAWQRGPLNMSHWQTSDKNGGFKSLHRFQCKKKRIINGYSITVLSNYWIWLVRKCFLSIYDRGFCAS